MTRPTALVTGATGFLGGHCVVDLLEHGYDVRATVRDVENPMIRPLRDVAQRAGRTLDVVTVSLLDDAGWDRALDGVDVVEHVASPAPLVVPKDPDALVKPAVAGTLRVLDAASAAGVKRVVVTSSIDAIRVGHDMSDGRVRTEDDWSVIDRCGPYARSKTLAERAAWDRAATTGMDLTVLNPGLILGPLLGPTLNSSVEVIRQLLAAEMPGLPNLGFTVVDVAAVAAAHRRALEQPGAVGRRYILAAEPVWLSDVARILADEFGPKGFRIPHRSIPSWLVRVGGIVDVTLRAARPFLDAPARLSSAPAERDLDFTPAGLEEIVVATAESLIAHGIVAEPARGWS